jgi:hypothetical protein
VKAAAAAEVGTGSACGLNSACWRVGVGRRNDAVRCAPCLWPDLCVYRIKMRASSFSSSKLQTAGPLLQQLQRIMQFEACLKLKLRISHCASACCGACTTSRGLASVKMQPSNSKQSKHPYLSLGLSHQPGPQADRTNLTSSPAPFCCVPPPLMVGHQHPPHEALGSGYAC